jgi:hypothetical protein
VVSCFYMLIKHKEPRLKSANKYVRLLEILIPLVRNSRIPIYSCKYSKRLYTIHLHQHLILILLKEFMRMDYRSLVYLIEVMTEIPSSLISTTSPISLLSRNSFGGSNPTPRYSPEKSNPSVLWRRRDHFNRRLSIPLVSQAPMPAHNIPGGRERSCGVTEDISRCRYWKPSDHRCSDL